MTLLQFQRLCVIRDALLKLHNELLDADGDEWKDSWIQKSVVWLDHEIDLELWDLEIALNIDTKRSNPDAETTEAPAEAEALVGAP